MNNAALLANLLTTKEKIAEITLRQMYASQKLDANAAKLKNEQKYETKYNNAFDDAQNVDKACKIGSKVYKEKGADPLSDEAARAYAKAKVPNFDEAYLQELNDKDVEYDQLKTMYDAMLEKLNQDKTAQEEELKNAVGDSGLLQS